MSYREEAIADVVAAIHRVLRARMHDGIDAAPNYKGVEAGRLFGMLLGLLGGQIRHVIHLHGLENRRSEARDVCSLAVRDAIAEHGRTGGDFRALVGVHLRLRICALSESAPAIPLSVAA